MIANIQKYGKNGWMFYVNNRSLRTNENGEGLFRMFDDGKEEQIYGLSEISLQAENEQELIEVIENSKLRV